MATNRPSRHGRRRRLDLASILALPIGIVVVLVGQAIEGGAMRSLLQGAVPAPTPVQSSPLPFQAPQQGAPAPAAPPSQTPNR